MVLTKKKPHKSYEPRPSKPSEGNSLIKRIFDRHRNQRKRNQCKECDGGGICEHQRQQSRCKDCMKKDKAESSAQGGRPQDAGGKRGSLVAGLGEVGAAKQPRLT